MIWARPSKLKALGILGMNERNGDYIMRYNPRRLYPLVDDKVQTKKLAQQHGIDVPELYGLVEINHQIREFEETVAGRESFVVKPAHGAGGNGVLVIVGKQGSNWRKASGELMDHAALGYHLSCILSGMFSLGGMPDSAIIEYMVKFDPIFDAISYQGVPDLRVIVFRGVPVAAMVRLPTRASDGKANLHQGAIGVGINLKTGVTGSGVMANELATEHPDTGSSTAGLQIPHWPKIVELAAQCADLVGLGYLGVDIVLDRDLGPLVLELNARPGLNVQLASGLGLKVNLSKVEAMKSIPKSAAERAALAQALA